MFLSWIDVGVVTFSLLMSVVSIVNTRNFWEKRKWKLVSSRHPVLTLTFACLCCVELFLIIPVLQVCFNNDALQTFELAVGSCLIFEVLHESFLIFLVCILAARLFLLYFEFKFKLAKVNQIWRRQINPKDFSFWLNHKQTLGNPKNVLFIIILLNVVIILLYIVLLSVAHENYAVYFNIISQFFVTLWCIIAIIVMLSKMNRILDRFYIHLEMKQLLVILIIYSFVNIINEALMYKIRSHLLQHYFQTAQYLVQILFFTVMTYVQTRMIIGLTTKLKQKPQDLSTLNNKLNNKNEKCSKCSKCSKCCKIKWKRNICSSSTRATTPDPASLPQTQLNWKTVTSVSQFHTPRVTLCEVLTNESGFELFVDHCSSEMNLEHILFIVEVAQYKSILRKYNVPDMYQLPNQNNDHDESTVSRQSISSHAVDISAVLASAHSAHRRSQSVPTRKDLRPELRTLFKSQSKRKTSISEKLYGGLTSPDARSQMFEYEPEPEPEPELETDSSVLTFAAPEQAQSAQTVPTDSYTSQCQSPKQQSVPLHAASWSRASTVGKFGSQLESFLNEILRLDWLPIAWQLNQVNAPALASQSSGSSNLGKNSLQSSMKSSTKQTLAPEEAVLEQKNSDCFPGTSKSSSLVSNLRLTPISGVATGSTNTPSPGKESTAEESDRGGGNLTDEKAGATGSTAPEWTLAEMTVDTHWLYKYSKYLFDKYVSTKAELRVNLPYKIFSNLSRDFDLNRSTFSRSSGANANASTQKKDRSKTSAAIQQLRHRLVPQISFNEDDYRCKLFLNSYLYRVFDDALIDVWRLVHSNIFPRFRAKKEFHLLSKKLSQQQAKDDKQKPKKHSYPSNEEVMNDIVTNGMIGSSMLKEKNAKQPFQRKA